MEAQRRVYLCRLVAPAKYHECAREAWSKVIHAPDTRVLSDGGHKRRACHPQLVPFFCLFQASAVC